MMDTDERLKRVEGEIGSNDFESIEAEIAYYQKIMDDFEAEGLIEYEALQFRELPGPELDTRYWISSIEYQASSKKVYEGLLKFPLIKGG